MQNRGQMVFGIIIITVGVLFLIGNFVDIAIGSFFWPLLLIGAGLWSIFGQGAVGKGTAVSQKFIGDIDRHGAWTVTDENFNLFIGDIDLDMRNADIPVGETKLRISAFIGDINLSVPEDVGVSVDSNAFISVIKMGGEKQEKFLSSLSFKTDQYKLAERKIQLVANNFISDIKVR